MHGTIRLVLALLAGTAVAMITIAAVESIGHQLYPVPAGLDFSDRAALERFTSTLPVGALLFVAAAWTLGAAIGGSVAGWLSGSRRRWAAVTVGGLVLLATVMNLLMIPHPGWFAVAGLLGVGAGTALAVAIAARQPRHG